MQNFTALAHKYRQSNPKAVSITFNWLLHLRWGAILCQIVLIGMVGLFFEIPVPLLLVTTIILFEVGSNFLFLLMDKKEKKIPEWLIGVILFIDIIFLTVLLSQTGGAMNPFTFLYLLHVVIASILLRSWLAWLLGIFTILCYASFFVDLTTAPTPSVPGAMEGAVINGPVCIDVATLSHSTENQLNLHLQGMLVAFAITTVSLIFFISRLRNSLDGYYETVALLKNEIVKNEKLAALATLAAGAAHEFSTPLSTIAVAAGEMLYSCKERDLHHDIIEDAALIKSQVTVCKDILDQLSADAGSHRGEATTVFTLAQLMDDLEIALPEEYGQDYLKMHCDNPSFSLAGPRKTINRIVKGLLKNAIDATAHTKNQSIQATFSNDESYFVFTISDQGEGMDEDILRQATEPFFTTKEAGKGMGLGLFLAQSVADRFAGRLDIQSQKNQGTTITLRLSLRQLGGGI